MKKMSLSEKWRNLSPADKRELKNAALIFSRTSQGQFPALLEKIGASPDSNSLHLFAEVIKDLNDQ